MRQYWIPALMSSELPAPDCPPVRVRLLGENLIAFRVTSGKVGLIQNACPHRGASLFFGRNEEEGLRCVYHGWKFDVDGRLRRHAVRARREQLQDQGPRARPTRASSAAASSGPTWAHARRRRRCPTSSRTCCRAASTPVQKVLRECNWMQALEGDIDTGHLGFLHLGAVKPEDTDAGQLRLLHGRRPRAAVQVVDTEFGTSYGAYRPAEEDTYYWRIAHFLFPFYTMIPTGMLGMQVLVRAWVPVDDEHTMFWSMSAAAFSRWRPAPRAARPGSRPGAGRSRPPAARPGGFEFLPDTTDWLGKFRLTQNKDNDYLIDREAQRTAELHRHPGHPPAGPGGHREHGADLRPHQEHLGTLRRDGHPHATPRDQRRQGAPRRGRRPAGRRQPGGLPLALRRRRSCRAAPTGSRRRRSCARPSRALPTPWRRRSASATKRAAMAAVLARNRTR